MPNVHLRTFLTLIPLVLQQGCIDTPQMDGIPVEGVAAPDVTVPLPPVYTPPSTGIQPAIGWGWSPTGEPPCTRRNDGTVLWHGGTWTVPLPAKPGDSIADVNFTIEAPTGNAGDPQVVAVELFSSASPTVLTQTQLTPMGMGNRVNSNAGLTSPHLVVSGETLQLVFVPLNGGDYAANDMKIDSAGTVTLSPVTIPLSGSAFVAANPSHPIDYTFGTAIASSFEARASVPVPVGRTILGVRATVVDNASDANAKLALQLIGINGTSTNVIASSPVSAGNGALQVLSITPGIAVAAHTAYQLRVYALGVPSAQDALWFAEVDYN